MRIFIFLFYVASPNAFGVTPAEAQRAQEQARAAEEQRAARDAAEHEARMAERRRFIEEEVERIAARQAAAERAAAEKAAAGNASGDAAARAERETMRKAREVAAEVAGSARRDAAEFQEKIAKSGVRANQNLNGIKPGDWIKTSSGYVGTYLGFDGRRYHFKNVKTGDNGSTGTPPEPIVGSYVVSQSGFRGRVDSVGPDGQFVLEPDASGRSAVIRGERASPEISRFDNPNIQPGASVEVPGKPGIFERISKVFSDGRILTEAGRIFKPLAGAANKALGIAALPLQILDHNDQLKYQQAAQEIAKGKCPTENANAGETAQALTRIGQAQANAILADCEKSNAAFASQVRQAQNKIGEDSLADVKKSADGSPNCNADNSKENDRKIEIKGKDGLVSKLVFKNGQLTEVDVRDPKQNSASRTSAAFVLDVSNPNKVSVRYVSSKTSPAQEEPYSDFDARLRCADVNLGYTCRPNEYFPSGRSETDGLGASSRQKPFADWNTDFIQKAHQQALKLKEVARKHQKSSDPLTSICNELGPSSGKPQTASVAPGRG